MLNFNPHAGLTLTYADWRDCNIHSVDMCYRDLQLIVDVLDEYSKLLQIHIQENPPKNFWAKYNKEALVQKSMQISDKLADVIGLDKSYPKCKKMIERQAKETDNSDVGGDAMTLAFTKRKGG